MKKWKNEMFDMILHFQFIYNPETIQTIHQIVFSPFKVNEMGNNPMVNKIYNI
jgi:hypothetical protein